MTAAHQFVLFVIGLISIAYSWRLIQQTLADMARDSLFELRDNLRDEFSKAKSLDTVAYKRIRALLNGYLANLEKVSIGSLLIWAFFSNKKIDADLHAIAANASPKLAAYVKDIVIPRANQICVKFTLISGAPFLPFAIPFILMLNRRRLAQGSLKGADAVQSQPNVVLKAGMQRLERPVAIITQSWAKESANSPTRHLAPC